VGVQGYLLTAQLCGYKVAHPCRYCWVSRENCNKAFGPAAPPRYATTNAQLARKHVAALRKGGYGTVGRARAKLKSRSLMNVQNGLESIPFGAGDWGVNGAALPDMLHQVCARARVCSMVCSTLHDSPLFVFRSICWEC